MRWPAECCWLFLYLGRLPHMETLSFPHQLCGSRFNREQLESPGRRRVFVLCRCYLLSLFALSCIRER